jgi:6-phosphogluconate dehydrogenase
VQRLLDLLSPGDVLVEGGNSFYRDSQRRAEAAKARGIHFLDCGTSGGIWGLSEGYCMMVGGEAEAVAIAQPIFDGLAGPGGFAHVGPSGAGHFTKMVHNGVEYGMMQAYAEGWELLSASELGIDVPKALELWRHGSVVRSWLLDLAVLAVNEDPKLEKIRGYAQDSGEGRWTVQEAVRLGVPAHVLSAALYARFVSRQEDSPAMKMIAALRNQFGGHAVKQADETVVVGKHAAEKSSVPMPDAPNTEPSKAAAGIAPVVTQSGVTQSGVTQGGVTQSGRK